MKRIISVTYIAISIFFVSCAASNTPNVYRVLAIILKDSVEYTLPKQSNELRNRLFSQYKRTTTGEIIFNAAPALRKAYLLVIDSANNCVKKDLNQLGVVLGTFQRGVQCNYINEDSIWLISVGDYPNYVLNLYNARGERKAEWLIKLNSNKYSTSVGLIPNSNNNPFFKLSGSNEFLASLNMPYYSESDSVFFNKRDRKVMLKLEKGALSVNYYFCKVPEENKNLFLGYFGKTVATVMNRAVICSYEQSQNIQVYDSNKLVGNHYAGVKNFIPRTEAFDYTKSNDRRYVPEHFYDADFYYDIVNNEKFIYRVCIRKKDNYVSEEGLIDNEPPDFSIVVLDNKFNYIGEIDMSGKELDFTRIFPTVENEFLIGTNKSNKYYRYALDI